MRRLLFPYTVLPTHSQPQQHVVSLGVSMTHDTGLPIPSWNILPDDTLSPCQAIKDTCLICLPYHSPLHS